MREIFCENCGVELQNPNQKFCPNCGNPVRSSFSLKLSDLKEEKIQFDADKILPFIDTQNKKIWIWAGSKVSAKDKFIHYSMAESLYKTTGRKFYYQAVIEKLIGDTVDWDYSEYDIVIVDEGEEPSLFKQFLEKVNASN